MPMPSNIESQPALSDDSTKTPNVVESPGTRKKRETTADRYTRHYDNLRVTFEKTIAGHYRNGEAYDTVGVLLLSWKDDDLEVWVKEIEQLREIFKDKFNYEVKHYHIPTTTALTGLNFKIAEFAHDYDRADKLGIVYYGGHGGSDENKRLKLFARSKPTHDGHAHVPFDDIVLNLQRCHADIFIIVDCCNAALAFGHADIGQRKFEILAAAGPEQEVDAPHGANSFTTMLCSTLLNELAREPMGFTTSKLYRSLYFRAGSSDKPFLFDQSIHDWGRISLQPVRCLTDAFNIEHRALGRHQQSASGDASLHLELRMRAKPKVSTMNELARAMQYLPHVKEIKFTQMYAPRVVLESFMQGVNQTMKVRPILTKLRKKIEARKTAEHENRPGQDLDDRTSIYNWDKSRLEPDQPSADAGTQIEPSSGATEAPAINITAKSPFGATAHAERVEVECQHIRSECHSSCERPQRHSEEEEGKDVLRIAGMATEHKR